jgi:hypothetical protein
MMNETKSYKCLQVGRAKDEERRQFVTLKL